MFDDPAGPIEHFSWGKFIIDGVEHSNQSNGKAGVGKDVRVIGDKVKAWAERKGHRLTPEMLDKLHGKHIDVLVIGIGVNGMMECPEDVKRAVRELGIGELILERTPDACRIYNQLYREGKRVAMLAHGTC